MVLPQTPYTVDSSLAENITYPFFSPIIDFKKLNSLLKFAKLEHLTNNLALSESPPPG
eukprot:Pgem_evm1s18531